LPSANCGVRAQEYIGTSRLKMTLVEINKKLVRDVFLKIELLLNEGEKEIFEYDIQAFMFLFLKRFLKGSNRKYRVKS
jgi:hypothetical protein